MNIALSFPVLNGETVTEMHVQYCRANGHATHTVDGAADLHCPRCGDKLDNRATVTPVSQTETEENPMRTYAEYLNSLTVKTLTAIVKQMGFKGYSKARKAELVSLIDDYTAGVRDEATSRDADLYPADVLEISDARPLNLVTGGTDSERSDTYGVNMKPAESPLYHKSIAHIMAGIASAPRKVAPVVFSHTPAKPAEIAPKAVKTLTPAPTTNPYAQDSTDDLIDAIRYMRPVLHKATGQGQVRIAGQVRDMYAVLRERKVNVREI